MPHRGPERRAASDAFGSVWMIARRGMNGHTARRRDQCAGSVYTLQCLFGPTVVHAPSVHVMARARFMPMQ
jgi:hypothetical protein